MDVTDPGCDLLMKQLIHVPHVRRWTHQNETERANAGTRRSWTCPKMIDRLYLHGVTELRTTVTGVSHSVPVSVRLHRVRDLGTVVEDVGDT